MIASKVWASDHPRHPFPARTSKLSYPSELSLSQDDSTSYGSISIAQTSSQSSHSKAVV